MRRGAIAADRAAQLFGEDANDGVAGVHESGVLDLSARQVLLREWLSAQYIPLFSLDEGTALFTEDEPLPPEKRIFVQSTAALLIEGVRSITNGLVLRRSIGDFKREIELARGSATRLSRCRSPIRSEHRLQPHRAGVDRVLPQALLDAVRHRSQWSSP